MISGSRYLVAGAALLAMVGPSAGDPPPEYDIRHWTMSEGLPQSSVTAIVESRDGCLWLGTFGGLARFDGHRFTVFSMGEHPGLGSDRIVSLHEDRAGDLWIGHERRGVTRLSGGEFTHFPPGDSVPAKEIWTIAEDREGRIWVGGERVARWDGERFERVELPSDAPWSVTWSIVADPNDGVWAATNDGLWRIDSHGARLIPDDLARSTTYWRPWHLYRDQQSRIWLHTPEGLHEVRGETLIERTAGGDFSRSVRDMLVDRRGQWWVAGRGGLFRSGAAADQANVSWHRVDGIDDEMVRCVLEDRDGNIWLGTDLRGVVCAAPRHHRMHGWSELNQSGWFHLAGHGSCVWSMHGWPKPRAVRLTAGEVDASRDLAELGVQKVLAAAATDAGTLWVADEDELIQVRERILDRRVHDFSSPPTAMIEHDGDLWCGGAGYVARLDGDRLGIVATFEAAPDEAVRRFTSDDAGRLWLITDHAVHRWTGDRLTTFDRDAGIPRSLRALAADSNGDVWVGGYGSGLARLRDGNVLPLTTHDGLPDNAISFITIEDGSLWANSNRGVFRFGLDQVDALKRGAIDRLRCAVFETGEANQNDGWHADDGTLYLPTLEGLLSINTRQLRPRSSPPVHVENVTTGAGSHAATGLIELPRGDRDLTIRYTAPRPANAGQLRFRYRLNGHDERWSTTSASREAVFQRLPPGAYRFEVVAADGDGPWSPEPAVLELMLPPFFYETWWFRGAVIGALAFALIMVHRFRIARAHERDRAVVETLIAAQEADRRRISLELHDDISQRLAAVAMTLSSKGDDAATDLSPIADEIRRLTTDVHAMSHQLHPSVLTNLGLAEAVRSECRSFTRRTGLATDVHVNGEFVTLGEPHALALFRILQEALRNSQRHAGSPSIRVDLDSLDGEVRLRVTDSGQGFDTAAKRSPGLGLRGMEERAQHLGGIWSIQSRVGEGTTVNVRFPCKPRRQ